MCKARLFCSLIAVAVISGCAHPLAIGPDISKIEREDGVQPIAANVGYYISPSVRERVVTTPGGGGDSVTYSPYKDIETGFYKMLSNVFQNVTRLNSPHNPEDIAKRSITYVITPEVSTQSSSPSPFTWPPTRFSVDLICNIDDAAGKFLTRRSVRGEGQAEFEEFQNDFSLSGKRATEDALLKMQGELLRSPELKGR